MQTYLDAVWIAADLLRDGADPEYRRGVVEILAELYAIPHVYMSDRMAEIDHDIDKTISKEKAWQSSTTS